MTRKELSIRCQKNDAIELSIAKMLRNGVPQQEAEIAAPIYLEAELWGKLEHGFRCLETRLLEYRAGTERRRTLTIQHETPLRALLDGGFHFSCFIHHTAMKPIVHISCRSEGTKALG